MSRVSQDRLTSHMEGDFVVFLIGMRINKPWKVHKWLPAALAMPRMLKELHRLPAEETGFLGAITSGARVTVQYWRSFEHLERYAKSKDHTHFPAWVAFNKRAKANRGDVGIWHETYMVKAGQYECVYSGMPPFGLGKAGDLLPATGHRATARARIDA